MESRMRMKETMKKRWIEVVSEADEKQEARFKTWLSCEGIPFVSPGAENVKAMIDFAKQYGIYT
jgi:hypothetical protein